MNNNINNTSQAPAPQPSQVQQGAGSGLARQGSVQQGSRIHPLMQKEDADSMCLFKCFGHDSLRLK